MEGQYGTSVRTALYYHQQHPSVTYKEQEYLAGIYSLLAHFLRRLYPEDASELIETIEPLSDGYLDDMQRILITDSQRAKSPSKT